MTTDEFNDVLHSRGQVKSVVCCALHITFSIAYLRSFVPQLYYSNVSFLQRVKSKTDRNTKKQKKTVIVFLSSFTEFLLWIHTVHEAGYQPAFKHVLCSFLLHCTIKGHITASIKITEKNCEMTLMHPCTSNSIK